MSFEIDAIIDASEKYKEQIEAYKYPELLFEDLEGETIDEKLASLRKKYKKLSIDHAADKYSHYDDKDLFDLSSDISKRINELKAMAEKRIRDGTYGTKNNVSDKCAVVNVGNREYRITGNFARKDMAEIYRGEYTSGKKIIPVWIKMARDRDDDNELLDEETIQFNNDSIANEIRTLKHIDIIKDAAFKKVRKLQIPELLDEFEYNDRGAGDDEATNANVRKSWIAKDFTQEYKAYDLLTLREKFPKGVPLYHACWILARILSLTGHLHFNKILHGNINPSGIYVVPQIHDVIVGDFMFSIIGFDSRGKKYLGTTPFYTAPEVKKTAIPDPRTDMYSIGACLHYLLGGDVQDMKPLDKLQMIPGQKVDEEAVERLKYYLSLFNAHPLRRHYDAWKAYHQLADLRVEAFGKPVFTEFKIPK